MSRPVRLRSSPGCKLSKNFPVNQELDAGLWIEFLGTVARQNWTAWHVSKKRADTVGELKSAEICVPHMPSLKAKKLGKFSQQKVLLEL